MKFSNIHNSRELQETQESRDDAGAAMLMELPADNDDLRAAIYDGSIFGLAANAPTKRLVEAARERLLAALGDVDSDLRVAPSRLANEEFFRRMGVLRRDLYLGEPYHELLRDLVVELGFDLERIAFDPLRLRIIQGGGEKNPAAKAVYYPHRDTWYGHPQSLIVGWIPLDDLKPEETFVFYPDYLCRVAENDSEIFDYDAWVRKGWSLKIGWQDPEAGLRARYPQMKAAIDKDAKVLGFGCQAAELLLFAGAHLHQTRVQKGERTRYSLDFRLVDLVDVEAGRGAPNVDNRSRGSAVPDYIRGIDR